VRWLVLLCWMAGRGEWEMKVRKEKNCLMDVNVNVMSGVQQLCIVVILRGEERREEQQNTNEKLRRNEVTFESVSNTLAKVYW